MDSRKEWDELVEWISKEDPPTWKQRNCILWADARIRALEEAVEWARDRFQKNDHDGWATMVNVLTRSRRAGRE